MATNTQIGKYVYSNLDLPMYGKILTFLQSRKDGASFVTIAGQPEMVKDFNGDIIRTQAKVKTALSNLRFRSVINEVNASHGYTVFKIANKDDALTLIGEAAKITDKLVKRNAEVSSTVTNGSASVASNSKKEKVNTMTATKTAAKTVKLFLNPETNKVEPFGAGRPSKVKLAYACDSEGKLLNPAGALAFAQAGNKSEDKLTKAELIDLLRKVRAERDEALAAVEVLKSAMESVEAEDANDDEDLDVEAEAVDSDEDYEADATEVG